MSEKRAQQLRVLAAAKEALKRHDNENGPRDLDMTRGFATAGETVMWIDMLDETLRDQERYAERRAESVYGRVVPGLVFIRNEIVHQRVLTITTHRIHGLTIPLEIPMRIEGSWFRWADGLRLRKVRHRFSEPQFRSYLSYLANEFTQDTLRAGLTWCERELSLPPETWAINSAYTHPAAG